MLGVEFGGFVSLIFVCFGEAGFDSPAKLARWLRLVGSPSPWLPSHLDCTPLLVD